MTTVLTTGFIHKYSLMSTLKYGKAEEQFVQILLRLDSCSNSYIFLNSEGLQVQRAAPFPVNFLISFLQHHTNAFYEATLLLTRLIQCPLNCGSCIQMWFRLK